MGNVQMIKTILLFTVILAGLASAFGSDTPSIPNMLAVAAQQAALLRNSERPFVMDVDFTVQANPPTQGHLRLRWEAKDRWWSRVSMGKFEQIEFKKGEWTYTLRNVDFTPKQVSDLMFLLHTGEAYDPYVTREDKQRTEESSFANYSTTFSRGSDVRDWWTHSHRWSSSALSR